MLVTTHSAFRIAVLVKTRRLTNLACCGAAVAAASTANKIRPCRKESSRVLRFAAEVLSSAPPCARAMQAAYGGSLRPDQRASNEFSQRASDGIKMAIRGQAPALR